MVITDITNTAPLAAVFLAPMLALLPGARHQRVCPQLSDLNWMLLGTARVLEDEPSGRAFLQKGSGLLPEVPVRSSFFEALASARRGGHCKAVNESLAASMSRSLPDPFAAFPALAAFDLYAGDGHFQAAAVHDARDADGKRHATGHVFLLNLRSQAMRHLDLCDALTRRKENEIRLLKRQDFDTLRGHAPKGRKVLLSYDRVVLDFRFWQNAKDTRGLYFVSRPKSNTALMRCGFRPVEQSDPVNAGIVSDEEGAPAATARVIRRITWMDPDTGDAWQFLTNEMTLPPGLIVLVYRRRWDIEKVFDEFKNKLCEKKSWASSVAAKAAQANFMCLTHNLMVLYEHKLAGQGIGNVAEEKRRTQRLEKRTAAATKASRKMPSIISGVQRLTVRSVKFVRWLRQFMWADKALPIMHERLRLLYAEL